MKRKRFGILLCSLSLVAMLFSGCARPTARLGSIPAPPESGRLRVYFKVISSGDPRFGWKQTEAQAEAKLTPIIARALDASKVCELVGGADLATVAGGQPPAANYWLRDERRLAREVGRALHADYGILMERHLGSFTAVRYLLINVHTGAVFEVSSLALPAVQVESFFRNNVVATWKKLYRMARKDLLRAALDKGAGRLPTTTGTPAHVVESAEPEPEPLVPPVADGNLPTLAVYDFAAAEPLRTAAVILADALREELLRHGQVLLVNRENLNQVLQELAVGQLGLTDERRAVEVGKALAAGQIVAGHLGALGESAVLTVKRIEVESQKTAALASARVAQGKEDRLLEGMEELARELVKGL